MTIRSWRVYVHRFIAMIALSLIMIISLDAHSENFPVPKWYEVQEVDMRWHLNVRRYKSFADLQSDAVNIFCANNFNLVNFSLIPPAAWNFVLGDPQYYWSNLTAETFPEVDSATKLIACPHIFVGGYVQRGIAQFRSYCPKNEPIESGMCVSADTCPVGQTRDFRGICGVSPKNNCSKCNVEGNPTNPTTGIKSQIETVYRAQGPHALGLELTYNSQLASALEPEWGVLFGHNWTNTYGRRLSVYGGNTVIALRPDGREWSYFAPPSGNVYTADGDITDVLTRLVDGLNNTVGWTLAAADGDQIETYSRLGALQSITNRNGLTQTLTYSDGTSGANGGVVLDANGNPTGTTLANGLLIRVTDAVGRSLSFGYDGTGRIVKMTDVAGQVTRFIYDGFSNLTAIALPDNKLRSFIYGNQEPANVSGVNLPYHLTGIVDENAIRFATYTYDAQGRSISTEHANGAGRFTFSYNPNGTTLVTDALNTQRTYGIQAVLAVAKVTGNSQPCTNCNARDQSRTYDANGNISSKLDWNNNRTNYTYDLVRNLEISRTEGLTSTGTTTSATRTTTTQWHPTYRLPTAIAEPLRKTTYIYNGDGGASCGLQSDGTTPVPGVLCSKTVQATADTNGSAGLAAAVTGSPRAWTYTYNTNGSVLAMTTPAVQTAGGAVTPVTTYTYYPNNATCPTTAPGASAIGCRGQIASVSNHLAQTTQITAYNAHGQPLSVTDPNGLVTTMAYDPRMRLTSRNIGGETTGYTYDGVGQLTKVTMPDLSHLEYQYDAAHRLTEIRLRDSSNGLIGKTTYTLDAMGNRTAEQIKDPADVVLQARSRVYNNLNRLIQDIGGTNPGSQITGYDYDNQGNLKTVTAPAGAGGTRSYTYDALNRLATQLDPTVTANPTAGGGTTSYGYNGLDQLTQVTDPRNLITSYNYDGLNNLNQQTSPDTGTTSNTYDTAGNILTSTDAKSQVTSYSYDALARVTSMTYNQATGTQLKTVTYQYDSSGSGNFGVGRLTQVTETAADNSTLQTTTYRYDQKGRLTQESRTLNGTAYVTGYGYDAAGRMNSISYPTGRTVNYTLDGIGRIASISTSKNGTTQTVLTNANYRPFGPITGFTYGNNQTYSRSYDLDGRTASYSQATQNVSLGYDFASRITSLGANSYGYDEIDRLVSATAPAGNQAFAYDKVGNRTSKTVGAATDTYSFDTSSNRLNQIIGASTKSYAYDANGSVTGEGTNTFTYDGRGRLTQAAGTLGISNYQVSSQGQRVRKSGAGGDTLFHYDAQGRLIAETGATGTLMKEYIYLGDLPVAVVQ